MKLTPAQLDEIKARYNVADVVTQRYGVALRRHGQKFIGPCPIHSPDRQARDSTAFECDDASWVCATCHKGGDVIALVREVDGLDFKAAIETLGGAGAAATEDPVAAAARQQVKAEREADTARYRQIERDRAKRLAKFGRPLEGSDGERYIVDCRGLELVPGLRLRCDPQAHYYVPDASSPRLVHKGPAIVAVIERDGKFYGSHSTFIDVTKPKGKLAIADPKFPDAGILNAKKMRGSKQGGHIGLLDVTDPHTLVIGEGWEKALAVLVAYRIAGRPTDGIAWWTSGDLGNLGGKAAGNVAHPTLKTSTGRAQRVAGAEPDLAAEAIEIPPTVKRVIVLGDSTSDPFSTQMTIARAAARWSALSSSLEVVCAWSPSGKDFDDLFRESGRDTAARASAAAAVLAIVDAAAPPGVPDASSFSAVASSPAASESPSSQKGGPTKSPRGGKGGNKTPPPPKPPEDDEEDPHKLNLRLAYLPRTDLGNAERFRERWRNKLLFSPTLPGAGRNGGWLWWDGKRWSTIGADERVKLAEHLTVRGIQQEAEACLTDLRRLARDHPDAAAMAKKAAKQAAKAAAKRGAPRAGPRLVTVDGALLDDAPAVTVIKEDSAKKIAVKLGALADLANSLKGWGRQSENNSKMVPISRQAAPYLAIEMAELDRDPFAFNCNNGTLVFRREWDADADPTIAGHEHWLRHSDFIKFKSHDPRDRMTKISPVDFVPRAECLGWLKFLADVQPELPMQLFLQCWRGYGMTGDTGEARVALLHGGGRNGKGVFETATGYVLGDYGGTTPIETFTIEARTRGAGQATPELAKLPGIRALRSSEPKKGARLDESLIKQVTGGDPIDARHLNRPFFTFLPHFKLTISTNHKPKIGGGDDAIWARLTLVPFEVFIPEEKRDIKLGEKLQAEASGILNWMLDGLSTWFEKGLVLPQKVRDATAQYRNASDQLGRFLETCCLRAPKEFNPDDAAQSKEWRARSSELLAVHNAWARAGGGAEWRQKGFTDAMDDRGFRRLKSSDMYFIGLKLAKAVGDFEQIDGKPSSRPRDDDGPLPEPIDRDSDDDEFPRM